MLKKSNKTNAKVKKNSVDFILIIEQYSFAESLRKLTHSSLMFKGMGFLIEVRRNRRKGGWVGGKEGGRGERELGRSGGREGERLWREGSRWIMLVTRICTDIKIN